jgi:hypothetical protein
MIAYRWHDTDVIQVSVSAWNGRFAGETNLYVGHDELEDLARAVTGFPSGPADTREVILGAFGERYAGGAVKLRFFHRDMAGHTQVEVSIEADYQLSDKTESATLLCDFEPSSLDLFVSQLQAFRLDRNGSAELKFVEG